MNIKIQFAFFWIGENLNIPANLVKSIRYIYGNEATIYMLTNLSTNKLNDVDHVIQSDYGNSLVQPSPTEQSVGLVLFTPNDDSTHRKEISDSFLTRLKPSA